MAKQKKVSDGTFLVRLEALDGNQRRLAEELGISPAAVCKRLKKLLTKEGQTKGITAKVVESYAGDKPSPPPKKNLMVPKDSIKTGTRAFDNSLDVLGMLIESNNILTGLLGEVQQEVKAKNKSNPFQRKQLIALADKLQCLAKTYFDIQATLYNARTTKHFIDAVLYVVSQTSPDLQRAIYKRLLDSGSLFQSHFGTPESPDA